ncbi:MAG: peptide chain release factor N(5)-glutamine methyltransferase [Geminicoccaceae bacterium]
MSRSTATVSDLLRAAAARLNEAGCESPKLDARLLFCFAAGWSRTDLAVASREPIDQETSSRFAALILRRCLRTPVAYLTGRREFWSLEFNVGPGVLVPRPESERLVELALNQVSDPAVEIRVLDMATGTGCLLAALLSELPAATGIGTDVSQPALAYARTNIDRLGLAGRAHLVCCPWAEALAQRFDLILCNPPYIRRGVFANLSPEVTDHEPALALDGGEDGLEAYRQLLPEISGHLTPAGAAIVEIGCDQGGAVAALARHAGFAAEIHPDLAGLDRALVLRHA